MKIDVIPIINVGVELDGGTTAQIPFHFITVTNNQGKEKELFIAFSFGTVISAEGMNERVLEYECKVGQMKEQLFNALVPKGEVLVHFLEGETAADIKRRILENIDNAPNGARLLLVWKRGGIDDAPFYPALGLTDDNGKVKEPTPAPSTLSALGYSVEAPFMEIPLEMASKATLVLARQHWVETAKKGR